MTTVFIAGSITIKNLDRKVKERIDKVIEQGYSVLVGDADGADTSIQSYLVERSATNATVYCTGMRPRNNVGHWMVKSVETDCVPGTRQFFTVKDLEMAKDADFGLMIWDTKSTGTLSNIFELLRQKKKAAVFVNKLKVFFDVGDIERFEKLVSLMAPSARLQADQKIDLSTKLSKLKHEQLGLFAH